MEKAQFHSLVVLQVKVLYCLFAALALSVIAVLDLIESHTVFAAVAAGFALVLLLYALMLLLRGHQRSSPYPEWILVLALALFTLFGMQQSEDVVHWVYFIPGFIYFLFPFHVASYLALIYSTAMVLMIISEFDSYLRLQILFTYGACYAFAVMYALINERNNQGLSAIVNTDPVTQVYNEYQLGLDLTKEMTRADRQSDELNLVGVAVPKEWNALKTEEYEERLSYLGKKLKRCLRRFDTCYRLNSDRFVILMPHSTEDGVSVLCENLMDDLEGSDRYAGASNIRIHRDRYSPEDDIQAIVDRIEGALNDHHE